MTAGCTGGRFFSYTHFRWLDADNPDQFVILWDAILPLPAPLPFASWIANQLPLEVANENKWWTFSSAISRIDVTRPNWWDATESDMRVRDSYRLASYRSYPLLYPAQRYFPEQMVPTAYLTESDSLAEMAAVMLLSMRQFLEDQFHFH